MKIKQDFGIGDEKVKFYPYWGELHPVSVSGKETYAVTWQNGDNYLVAVANLSLNDQEVTVTLNKKFFDKDAKVVNAETKENVKHDRTFSVKIPRRNYQLYLITE